MMRVHSKKENGYSLLELSVAMTVLGVLVAIAVPTISGFMRTARLAGTANTLEADLHYAHALATAQRKSYQILFHAGSYTLMRISPPDTIRRREMPGSVACTATDTAKFYAWGLTDPVTITVADDHGSQTVRVLANGSVTHD